MNEGNLVDLVIGGMSYMKLSGGGRGKLFTNQTHVLPYVRFDIIKLE